MNNISCKILLLLAMSGIATLLQAQSSDTLEYTLNARSSIGNGSYAPFLSTANQWDRHSFSPNSLSLWGTLHKHLNASRTWDYEFGAEVDATVSRTEQRLFPGELYVGGKLAFIRFIAGMKRETYGDQDPELSSGGMIDSRNARPIPRLTLESNDWVNVPFTKGYAQVRGGLTHGWFTDSTFTTNTLLHHKWAYIRLGGNLPVRIHYGLQHVCQWAGTSPVYGHSPASWENYYRIFLGHSGNSNSPLTEKANALGNHILSKNLGLELWLPKWNATLYWQNIYEDGPISRMNLAYNVEDGLWGLSVRIPSFKPLHSFAVEFLSTTDQSGPWHDLDGVIYGGADSYYFNGVYQDGWTFYDMTLGNPWLTSPKYNSDGIGWVQNNIVRLWYFSGMGSLSDVRYHATLAYSRNFGFTLSPYTTERDQFSGQLELSRNWPGIDGLEMNLGLSADRGTMYGNNFALLVGVRYTGRFTY